MLPTQLSSSTITKLELAINDHRLPDVFKDAVTEFYWPMAKWLGPRVVSNKPHILGIQGSQGSGKSTCAHFLRLILEEELKLRVAVVSLDDFYLIKSERIELAKQIHPLLRTRGVPGTHDTELIQNTFSAIKNGEPALVPVFDKAKDDRVQKGQWQSIDNGIDLLIFEGWCVGVPLQNQSLLLTPINSLEREEDAEATWRNFVNDYLQNSYASIYAQLDTLIALQAPSFDCVFNWRLLQEQKLISRLEQAGKDFSGAQTPEQIQRFISHYQRLTEHAIATMPDRADALLYLNADHSYKKIVLR